MKRLQEYINESYDINEGKIWDAIVNWFKNLFEPSDKKYDRYATGWDYSEESDFRDYLRNTWSNDNIKVVPILTQKELNKIVKPSNDAQVNKDTDTGFWKFTDDKIENKLNTKYYAFRYENKEIKDIFAIIKLNFDNNVLENYTEILNLQILKEYYDLFNINDLIKDLYKEIKELNSIKGLFIKKNTDKALYNKLVNDINFTKETINNKINIARKDKK